MWMSEAPRFRASIRRTFDSLMTGAASEDFDRAPRSISSSSVLTVSTSASSSARESMSTSDRPHGGHVVEGEGRAVDHVLEGRRGAEAHRPHGVPSASARHASIRPQLQGAGRSIVLFDGLFQGDLGGHHRLHVVARHELDVVHGEHVRGIRHGDRERGSRTRQRKNLVLSRRLGRNDLDDGRVHLEVLEVDGGNAILPRQQARDLLVADVTEGDEGLAELATAGSLVSERLLELLRSHHVLLQQQFAELDRHSALFRKT